MRFQFDKQRATEAAGVLLRGAPNRQMTRLRLLKLMYIADRESIKKKGRPITGDRYVAMDQGPVLSGVYDMIKNTHVDPGTWPGHIRTEHNDVFLTSDPGVGNLSRYEVAKLQEIWTRYEDLSDWDLVRLVHEYKEWIDNQPSGSSRAPTISHREILVNMGREAEADEILQDASEEVALDEFWNRVMQS